MKIKAVTPFFIKLENAAFKIYNRVVFDNTDWQISSNENWAVYGPIGSGINLLLEAVLHRLHITKGKIEYFFDESGRPYLNQGEAVLISNDSQRDMLLHYNAYYQARWQSIEEENSPFVNDFLSGKSIEHHSPFEITPLRTADSIYKNRKNRAVKKLKIKNLLHKRLAQLSNGEARKVLFARALMQNPRILILDDPFSGLDVSSRKILRTIINELMTVRSGIIITSHSRLDEIPDCVTHMAYVEHNHIVKKGLKREMVSFLGAKNLKTLSGKEKIFNTFPEFPPDDNPENPYLIQMDQVSIKYGKKKILDHICWDMRKGENWAILGANGAGKTTLISLLTGDNPQAYANNIFLFGKKRGGGESIWEIKKRIGWVAPELQLYYYSAMRCIDVVYSGLYESIGLYHEVPEEQKLEAEIWLRFLKSGHLKDASFSDISAAEQMPVLLARALIKKPRLLILDELFQNINDDMRVFILDFIELLCEKQPVNLIYVTHYEKEMPRCISNILSLDNGRVVKYPLL